MRSVLIINPKGGSGKTTLATNLAGGLACAGGEDVRLWDLDRQHSALEWLSLRPADRPQVSALSGKPGENSRSHGGAGWLVLDAPAGIHGKTKTRLVASKEERFCATMLLSGGCPADKGKKPGAKTGADLKPPEGRPRG